MTDENLVGLTEAGPKFGSRWVHRKSGKVYTVQFTALREEDLTPVVVYHSVDNLLMWAYSILEYDRIGQGYPR